MCVCVAPPPLPPTRLDLMNESSQKNNSLVHHTIYMYLYTYQEPITHIYIHVNISFVLSAYFTLLTFAAHNMIEVPKASVVDKAG